MSSYNWIKKVFSRRKFNNNRTDCRDVAPAGALDALTLKEAMVPRADIIGASYELRIDDLVKLFLTTGFRAFPVYRDTKDHIVGVIEIHQVLLLLSGQYQEQTWQDRIRQVFFFASPSMPIKEALVHFQKEKNAFIMIVDEFGGIKGLTTRGKIIEYIVQDLQIIESDDEIFATSFREDGAPVVDGRVELETIEEEFATSLRIEEQDVQTLGGLVCTIAGRVPMRGEIIEHPSSGLAFEIVEADQRRIKLIAILNTAVKHEATSESKQSKTKESKQSKTKFLTMNR